MPNTMMTDGGGGLPKFTPRLTKPDRSNEYYQAKNNPWRYSPLDVGNCTTYAWCRFHEIMGSLTDKSGFWTPTYNAEDWYGTVRGYEKGPTPRLGAILCLRDGNFSGWGHVAIVEEIKENGDIVTSEGGLNAYTFEIKTRPKSQNYVPYGGYGFQGFIYCPINFSGSEGYAEGNDGTGINWEERASHVVSSDNYSYIQWEEEQTPTSSVSDSMTNSFKAALNDLKNSTFSSALSNISQTLSSILSDAFAESFNQVTQYVPKMIEKKKSFLSLGANTVEAPFIELDLGGYKIGSYGGTLDLYPNYVSSLKVSKQNGIINQYTIQLIHQVRPGDDSNLLDELLSTVNYRQITIKYGDCNTGTYFQDANAILTNVSMSRSYTNMNISYTLEATSAGELVKTYTSNFSAVVDKPSNIIRDMLYSPGNISDILLSAFPGMRNRTFVESNNLIPTNDHIVDLEAQRNVNLIDYLNYLVGNMSNETTSGNLYNSLYYLTFMDNDSSNPDGAYFKITEIKSDVDPRSVTDKLYSVTVGYVDDIIYNFSVDSTESWELLYKNSEKATEYFYTISNAGELEKTISPSLATSLNSMCELSKNWWTQMVKFPLTAQLTIKGLLKPIMLMDYINVDVMFYGVKHITSGTYAIIGQTDSLSGNGYTTTLSLVRVGQ